MEKMSKDLMSQEINEKSVSNGTGMYTEVMRNEAREEDALDIQF